MNLAIRLIVIFALLLYAAATALYFLKKEKAGYWLHGGAFAANLAVVIYNWAINGYVPFVSMSQVMTFVAGVFPLVYLYVRFVKKLGWTVPWFSLCSSVFLLGVSCMNQSEVWHFPPALQSPFFVPHVMSYMLAYALCAAAFCLTICTLATKSYQSKLRCDAAIYTLTLTAFPFMLLGCFLGALWANECWGTYWAWDPKETWSLVTGCLYALYFHTRRVPALAKFNNLILICAFCALIVTFLGVSVLNMGGEHAYA